MGSPERVSRSARVIENKNDVLQASERGLLQALAPKQQDLLTRRYLEGEEIQSFRQLSAFYREQGRSVSFQALKKTDDAGMRKIRRLLGKEPEPNPLPEIPVLSLVIDYNMRRLPIESMARQYGLSQEKMRRVLITSGIQIRPGGKPRGK